MLPSLQSYNFICKHHGVRLIPARPNLSVRPSPQRVRRVDHWCSCTFPLSSPSHLSTVLPAALSHSLLYCDILHVSKTSVKRRDWFLVKCQLPIERIILLLWLRVHFKIYVEFLLFASNLYVFCHLSELLQPYVLSCL